MSLLSTHLKKSILKCPRCAASVSVRLPSSVCVSCRSCKAMLHLQKQEDFLQVRHHFAQPMEFEPDFALDSVVRHEGVSWEIVGFQVRRGQYGHEEHEEQFVRWREYVLHNSDKGFGYLIDDETQWAWVRETHERVIVKDNKAVHLGMTYTKTDSCTAKTLMSQGEFSRVVPEADDHLVQDYTCGPFLLTREQAKGQVRWYVGQELSSDKVAQMLSLDLEQVAHIQKARIEPMSLTTKFHIGLGIAIVLILALDLYNDWRTRQSCRAHYDANSSVSQQEQYQQCMDRNSSSRSSSGGHK